MTILDFLFANVQKCSFGLCFFLFFFPDSNIKDKPAIEGNEVAKNLLELSTPIVQSETQTQLVIASKNSCIVQGPHCKVQHFESQDPLSCDKYGYRISVDSLFSTSFFPSSQFNPKVNKDIEVETEDLYRNHKSDCGKIGEIREISGQAPALNPGGNKSGYSLQDIPESSQIKADVAVKPNINQTKSASFLAHDSSLESSVLKAHAPDYEHARNYDIRIISPRSGAEKVNESSHFSEQHKFNSSSPRNELLHKSNCDVQSECIPELISDPPFASPDIKLQTYKHLSDKVEDSFSQRDVESDKLTLLTSVESSEIDAVTEKDTSFSTQQLNHGKVLNHPDRGKASKSEMHSSTLPSINYDDVPNHCTQLQTEVYTSSREGDTTITLPVTINKTLLYTETQLHSSRSEKDKQLPEKNEATTRSDGDDTQVHRPTFSQVPYMPNPFLGHSLLTHRHAIPSAFVYPSRVGIPGSHSGFNEIGQHSGTSPR